ncbi:MAG: GxxExxY protein [Candidatus Methanoperedens sp.]|nr:GxxExxY protein [Candidatus Methanoperedens sp.]
MSLLIFHYWELDKFESADQYQAHSCMGLLKNKPQINADERRLIKTDEETCFLNRNSIVNSHIFDEIIIELKTVKEFDDIHIAQCLNYLKITGLKLCLLINFSKPRVDIKRIVRGFGNK